MPLTKKQHQKTLPNQVGAKRQPTFGRDSYFSLSMRPLHILLFLAPIIILYELGSLGVFGPVQNSLEAHQMLVKFFDLFGVMGLHLPALMIVVTLLFQHVLSRDPTSLRISVVLKMLAESAILTGPLIVLVMILEPIGSGGLFIQQTHALDTVLIDPSQTNRLVIALGAGLYEELLFRLVLITIIHFLVSDVLGYSETKGFLVGVIVSSAAFAWHHDQIFLMDGSLDLKRAFFYMLAGMYFSLLFLMRGFGIAVGVHILYDLLVLIVIPSFDVQ